MKLNLTDNNLTRLERLCPIFTHTKTTPLYKVNLTLCKEV